MLPTQNIIDYAAQQQANRIFNGDIAMSFNEQHEQYDLLIDMMSADYNDLILTSKKRDLTELEVRILHRKAELLRRCTDGPSTLARHNAQRLEESREHYLTLQQEAKR